MKSVTKITILFISFSVWECSCNGPLKPDSDSCDINRNHVTAEAHFNNIHRYIDGPRESLITEDADKTCHARMRIEIWYPRLLRIYKNHGEVGRQIEKVYNVKDHVGFEFGVLMHWFPVYETSEYTITTLSGDAIGAHFYDCDQADKNNPDDYVRYRTEVWLRPDYRHHEVYQVEQEYLMSEEQFQQKFDNILDSILDFHDDYFHDENYFFRVYNPASYRMTISYTQYIPDET